MFANAGGLDRSLGEVELLKGLEILFGNGRSLRSLHPKTLAKGLG